MLKIDQDQRRFKQIVRGKIRENLRKYITHGEMIGRKGRDLVSIPVPQLDVPHFRYGQNGSGGVGQGDGEDGTPIAGGDGQQRQRAGRQRSRAPTSSKSKSRSRSWPRSWATNSNCPASSPRARPTSLRKRPATRASAARGPNRCGTSSGRTWKPCGGRFRRTPTTPTSPLVVPIREDKRYRSWTTNPQPQTNAVVIYMMDVSGSMTDEQKEIVRTEAFWLDTWLASQYDGVEVRYIIHDAAAKEVDEETFYHTRESGGTRISSAYKVCLELIRNAVPAVGMEHLLLPVLRRRQLGRRQRAEPASCLRDEIAAAGQPVLLRPGRKPLRQRRIHPRAASTPSATITKNWCSRRSKTKKRFTIRSRSFWERESNR